MESTLKKILSLALLCLLVVSCEKKQSEGNANFKGITSLHIAQQGLSDAMVHDIFSPPLASRTYAYSNLAAYYVMNLKEPDTLNLFERLNGFQAPELETELNAANSELAAILAFYNTAERLLFTNDSILKLKANLLDLAKTDGLSEDEINHSKSLALKVSKSMLDWAAKDGYTKIRLNDGYLLSEQAGAWQPTPPTYHEAILPSWNTLRPFILDSATQFKPPPPPPYSMEPESKFYRDLMQVYETSFKLDQEQREIAGFWDCNPFVVQEKGHLMIGLKKISPGGHWIGITKMVLEKEHAPMLEASKNYSLVSLTLADAFISCWDEKYRSNYIRPVTIINRELDANWKPLLQTPPFPEYTSGHSVISTAASVMLTQLYGDNYVFTDSVEISYGLDARSFESFRKAADEAAISRLYGGIHYMPAIELGVQQGERLGNFIIDEIFE